MKATKKNLKSVGTKMLVLHYLPRILCILSILFISLFAADAFEGNGSILQKLFDFFLHLVPSLILFVMLVIAWKREFFGGVLFVSTGLIFSPFIYIHNYQLNTSVWMSIGIVMLISFPFILVGVLFIMNYFFKRKIK